MKKAVVIALAALMVFGVAGAALADTALYDAAGITQTAAPVQVTASVNPKITLSVTTPDLAQTVAFGPVNPGTAYTRTVGLEVKSNKAWSMTVTPAGDVALIGLTTTAPASMPVGGGSALYAARGIWTATDTYSINVPWGTEALPYLATVQYSVTQ